MKLHMAVLKTVKTFNEMSTEQRTNSYAKAIDFLMKYKDNFDSFEVLDSTSINNPHQQYLRWTLSYTNANGEKKRLCVLAYEDVTFNRCSLGVTWY